METLIIITIAAMIIALSSYVTYFFIRKTSSIDKKYQAERNRANRYFLWFTVFVRWIENERDGKKLEEYLLSRGYEDVAVYGAGVIYDLVYAALRDTDVNILYAIDRTAFDGKKRTDKNGLPIITAHEIPEQEKVDAVIVTCIQDYAQILKLIRDVSADIEIVSLDTMIYSL